MAQFFSEYTADLESYLSAHAKAEPGLDITEVVKTVVASLYIPEERPQMFGVRVCHEGITAIRYDLTTAIGAVLALVGGIAGGPGSIAAVAAVLGCLLAIRGVGKRVPQNLARIVFTLYKAGGKASARQIHELFVGPPTSLQEVEELLRELRIMGAVDYEDGVASLQESVIVRYTSVPQSLL